MTDKQLLEQALDALDNLLYWDNGKPEYDEAHEAITAIRARLEQPAPVQETDHGDELNIAYMKGLHRGQELAAQRQWVGLTEEEIKECFKITPDQYLTWHIYTRIEAKLKEKNA
jgi:hypothetical protein